MYLPAHFAAPDRDSVLAFIHAQPLATLVRQGPDGLVGDPLPFLFDAGVPPHGRLRCHVARANPLWRQAADAPDCLVVVQGPSAYVSPNWYPGKADTHKAVPTWNYSAVHLRGRMRVVDDREWLRALVDELTTRFEHGRAQPWSMADAPPEFIAQMLRAIVGIEVEVLQIEAKFKLGQNRPAADREGTIRGLEAEPPERAPQAAQVAGAMRALEARRAADQPTAGAQAISPAQAGSPSAR